MMKSKVHLSLMLLLVLATLPAFAQIGGNAGAFTRMGYHARGMAMGNALTAVTKGDLHTYYNPAISPFAKERLATVSFGVLSLDRYLNFLDYIQPAQATAGISGGLINSGVRNIDGRNDNGEQTEAYSTSENQFFLSFANRFEEFVSVGITIKLYYYKLFDKISTTTVGFDAGFLLPLTDALSFGFVVQDIGSKYRWDTNPIYGTSGASVTDRFPTLYRGGLAYQLPMTDGTISLDVEMSSEKTTTVRFGAELSPHEYFTLRGGLDRWNPKDRTAGTRPSFGFGLKKPFEGWTPALDYAYGFEPFSPSGIHLITLSVRF